MEKDKFTDTDMHFIKKLRGKLKTDDDRCLCLVTMIGVAGVIITYLSHNTTVSDLPITVRYACAIAAANLMSLTSDGETEMKNLAITGDYKMSEQTQEAIYRRMKWIVETLYHQIQEEEKMNEN